MSIRIRKSVSARTDNVNTSIKFADGIEYTRCTVSVLSYLSRHRRLWRRAVDTYGIIDVATVAENGKREGDAHPQTTDYRVTLPTECLDQLRTLNIITGEIVYATAQVPNFIPSAGRETTFGGQKVYTPCQRRMPNPPRGKNTGPGVDKVHSRVNRDSVVQMDDKSTTATTEVVRVGDQFLAAGSTQRAAESIGRIARVPGERDKKDVVVMYKETAWEIDRIIAELNTTISANREKELDERLAKAEEKMATLEPLYVGVLASKGKVR